MAYHYALNTDTTETRRILTSSLPTYQAAKGWLVFDTEEERDAFKPIRWFTIHYPTRRRPERVTAANAAVYWTAQHLRAGWAVFSSEEAASAALAAMVPRYAINPNTGDVRAIALWLAPDERGNTLPGFTGDYASEGEARAALPPQLVCLHASEGYEERCYPARRAHMEADGYIVRATLAECRAALPVRWVWDNADRRYVRATRGRVMTRASAFAQLRGALRALQEDQESFRLVRGSFNTRDVLATAASFVMQQHNPAPHDFSETYNRRAIFDFSVRVNSLLGRPLLGVCGDCKTALTLPGALQFEGRALCSNCQGNYMSCSSCGCLMAEENARENARGATVCREHWHPVEEEPDGELRSYSTDIMRLKNGFLSGQGEKITPQTLWLGWELEVHAKGEAVGVQRRGDPDEDCDDCGGGGYVRDDDGDDTEERCACTLRGGDKTDAVRRVQQQARQWCIVKEDGSLNNGLEIVSVPASLRWHRENVVPFLATAQSYLSGWPHNDCGIHVHVGKKQLSELQQSRLVRFMHGDANQRFLTGVAGRDPNTYCNRGGVVKSVGAFKQEQHIGRYQALNFSTRNYKTIEFRIFRSNVSPAGFMKNLEFVHAACQWARFTSDRDLGHASLIDYVRKERHAYPSLVRFFESNGTLPAPRRHPDAPVPALHIAA
jgi:hypothetical protein